MFLLLRIIKHVLNSEASSMLFNGHEKRSFLVLFKTNSVYVSMNEDSDLR